MIVLLAAGCRPDFGAPLSRVSSARVAAVKLEPAEAAPGATVTATAFVVSPDGAAMPAIAWSLCLAPKPTTVNDVVDPSCLQPGGTSALGSSAAPLPVTLPSNGCRLFGPDTPPQTTGQPPAQSRAPDVTGGYYQPLRLDLDGAPTIALARIRCALAGASFDVAAEYAAEYAANRNPSLTPLAAFVGGTPVALDAIDAGSVVTLAVGWTAESVESFPVLDPAAQRLVTHREAMTVSWLASDGTIASANSGRGEDEAALFTTTTWTAPPAAGVVHLFVVLRDSRGGVDVAAWDAQVR
ncbi:MAG: hypothetical protein JWM53_1202 [bacterium]|nr:hypothetical protein [bacterium]